MFRSLRNRNYRYYAAGSAVSNIGTWLQRVAQDWLVLQLTAGSGMALGITTGLQFLPFLLIAPFGGLIADRFPKRRVLQCTQVAMGLTAAVLAVLDLTGLVQVWHVYVLAFLFGVAGAIDNPARQSFVVEMVGKDDLSNAVGLNSASFNGARVIGPAIAGVMIMFVGTGWVILANALTYGATIWALAKMRGSELHTPTPVPRKPGMLLDAVQYVRGRPDLILVLTVVFFVGCFGLNFQLTSALMATQVFGKGAGGYGVLGSVMAVGAVAGALGAARRGSPRLRLVVISAVGFGILEIVSGVMPTYLTFALSLPILGFVQLSMITAANAMMQLTVAPEMRGRVIALYSMVFIGSTPLGAPIVGWVGESYGARWTLIGGGLVSMLGALVATWLVLRRDQLVVRAHLRPRPHLHLWTPADFAEPPSRAWTDPAADRAADRTADRARSDAAASGATPEDVALNEVTESEALPDGETPQEQPGVGQRPVEREPVPQESVQDVESGRTPVGPESVDDAGDQPAPAPPAQVEAPRVPLQPRMRADVSAYEGSTGRRAGVTARVDEEPPGSASASGADAPTAEPDAPAQPDAWSAEAAEADRALPAHPSNPTSSRCSKPTAHDSSKWRARDSARRTRRARAGRSKTS